MAHAIATEEDFAIQYDDSIVCDVCKEVRCNFMVQMFQLVISRMCRKRAKRTMK